MWSRVRGLATSRRMRAHWAAFWVCSACGGAPPESVGEYCSTITPLYCDREIYCLRSEGVLIDEAAWRPTCEAVFYGWCCDAAGDCERKVHIDSAALWGRCLLAWEDRGCDFVLGDRSDLTPPVCERL